MDGTLEKMRIVAYTKATFSDSDKVQDGEFNVKVNPETYALNYQIEYSDDQASGTSADLPKFDKVKPLELSFKFIFDSTGALPGTTDEERENGITVELSHFKKVVFEFIGEKHAPPFIELIWGKFIFRCVLTGMKINYKLFKPDGTPVRAQVEAKFKELVEPNKRLAQENKQSPDLTHVRMVKEGDILPLMCQRIYGHQKYYLEVARINKLISFRNLKVGTRIEFPPLNKN